MPLAICHFGLFAGSARFPVATAVAAPLNDVAVDAARVLIAARSETDLIAVQFGVSDGRGDIP
jgi:hypothetical protein